MLGFEVITHHDVEWLHVVDATSGMNPLGLRDRTLSGVLDSTAIHHVDLPGLQVHDIDLDRGVMETTRVRPRTMAKI
jgi:site-specific recombinase XerC